MRALTFMAEFLRRYSLHIGISAGLWALVGVVDTGSILAVAPLVDLLAHGGLEGAGPLTRRMAGLAEASGAGASLGGLLGLFVAFNVLLAGVKILARYWILRTKYVVSRDLMVGTFEDFFGARWQFFSAGKAGTLLNTFTRELNVVGDAFSSMALFFAGLLIVAVYLMVPLWISWKVTAASFAAAVLGAAPLLLLGRLNYDLGRRNTATANRLWHEIVESMTLAKVVLGYGNAPRAVSAVARAYDEHFPATLRFQTLDVAIPILYYPVGMAVIGAALWSAHRLGVPLAETAALLFALSKIVPAVGQIAAAKNSLDNFFPSYEQVTGLREAARALRQPSGARRFAGLSDAIVLEGVSFSYPDREPALRGVSLRAPRGRMVAFVGESGAGKSTLIDLVLGFHEPVEGRVLVDGVPLQDYDISSYRHRIGYVPQDSLLFDASIRDNLRWAKEDATEDEVRAACRQAFADEFVERLPEGLDTVIGARGTRLSGGQAQRLALARALLRRPDILILDEATSALDTESERLIQRAIESADSTTLVIAHRLSTIVNADHVVVLQRGRVVQQGSYAELSGREGPFQRMARLQAVEAAAGPAGAEPGGAPGAS